MQGYRLLLASDVSSRDGLGLELYDSADDRLAEVFRDDITGERRFTAFSQKKVPLDVISWFLASASERL